jgi:hypothetical protein
MTGFVMRLLYKTCPFRIQLGRRIAITYWHTQEHSQGVRGVRGVKCLREKSATELINIQRKLETNGESFNGPTIDEADGVLPGSFQALLRNRRPYRLMIGTTSREFRFSKVIVNKKEEINGALLLATGALLVESRGNTKCE